MVLLTEISSSNTYQYDVFLSFRGVDTRLSFINHLYEALLDANLTTFLDDEQIQTGEQLKPELESAIKSSKASIIVLSKNYASSTWCLDELVLILEQKRSFNQIVIPIFYHVEPTHVRKQQSSFGEAMAKHKHILSSQKIELWKRALKEVADLKGIDAKGRKEMDLIEEVVTDIHRRLGGSSTLPFLIGMDFEIEVISSWLTDGSCHTADFLTAVGMGGIGKTSLAKYVFQLHSCKFQKSSFIEGINARCNDRFNGLLDLQKQLHGDICKNNPLQAVNDVFVYTSKIENALARKRALLVLDDIGSLDQLDALLGNKGLHPGSKIIITTKDASITERCALFNAQVKPTHREVSLKGLYEFEASELLCRHAFKSQKPKEGYKVVLEKLVKYCQGHPLALTLLGRSLYNRDVAYWEDCIKVLKKEPHSRINTALKMSFDSLPFENDKDLFKHIACFFVGVDKDVTETILNACDMNTRSGITNLIDRRLLSIGFYNKLMMHQLVREMGRDLVRQESPEKPWERSRLWCHEESFKVLDQKKGTGNILGLALDTRMLEHEKLSGSLQLKTDALSKMDSLKLLQLNYVEMNGSYKDISKELTWLCMHGFHLKSIPSELPMENLVVLDMSHSYIESFDMSYSKSHRFVNRLKGLTGSRSKDKRLLGSLKILDLSFCEQLRNICGFLQLPALERLIISNCTSLIRVSESIEHCVELLFIDLSNCKKLKKLPRAIGTLKKVKTILSNGCDLSVFPTEIRDMDSLQNLKVDNIGINSQTSSSACMEVIQRDLMPFMSSLPISLVKLSLKNNNLSNKSFPMDFSSLSMLEELCLDGNPIVSMPSCLRTLPRLQILGMSDCRVLETVEHPPVTLRLLWLRDNNLSNKSFPMDLSNLSMLKKLYLDGNPIGSMPSCVRTLPRLEKLSMMRCKMLETVEHPPSSLRQLELGYLVRLQEVRLNPEMSPLSLRLLESATETSFVVEGVITAQPLAHVENEVLRSLGWAHFELIKYQYLQRFIIQMYFEFGIFSTIYGGKEMPNWICCRSKGSLISFTIPSSPNKLRGLNFCYVLENLSFLNKGYELPLIIVSNITKNSTWIYHHFISSVDVAEECIIFLSHWMFGKNEMEDGDQLTISTATDVIGSIGECGVGLVYDEDGKTEEEDALGYYKSWNHIIGGDLSGFQTTTGEYILFYKFIMLNIKPFILPHYCPFLAASAHSKGERIRFRAFSQKTSDLAVHRKYKHK